MPCHAMYLSQLVGIPLPYPTLLYTSQLNQEKKMQKTKKRIVAQCTVCKDVYIS